MRLAVVLGAACAALLLGASAASAAPARGDRLAPAGTVVVGFDSEAALRAALARSGARLVRIVPELGYAEVEGDVEALPGIRSLERVRVREPQTAPVTTFTAAPLEWQVSATRLDAVPPDVLRSARRITIAVIDTGADLAAPDLAAKTPSRWNVRSGGRDVADRHGHGTFVASLAAGSVSNGEGMAGFGGDARLLVVKAGGADGRLTDLEEADAIVYAVRKGAKVINISLGGVTTSPVEREAIDFAVRRGVLVVAAAGNGYERGNAVEYPAALLRDRGLAVGASTRAGTRAAFSSTGAHVALAAPGEEVFAAVSSLAPEASFSRIPLAGSTAGVYGIASGTSFAAPQVAGAAALVWGANPKLRAADVARILKETATGAGVRNDELGFGVLDVAAAVAAARASVRS
jgi:subtilisin family serine protease